MWAPFVLGFWTKSTILEEKLLFLDKNDAFCRFLVVNPPETVDFVHLGLILWCNAL
jgi:hypothetical protein